MTSAPLSRASWIAIRPTPGCAGDEHAFTEYEPADLECPQRRHPRGGQRGGLRVGYMCPFCVRDGVSVETTGQSEPEHRGKVRRARFRALLTLQALCAYLSDPVSFSRVVT